MMLKVHDISFKYGSVPTLEGVGFEVGRGGSLGIVGPNGSGKTTLLRCMSRLLRPEGIVLIEGRDISQWSVRDIARRVGVVPQRSNVTMGFTAFEVVLMGRTPHIRGLTFESEEDIAVVKRSMLATDTWHLRDRRMSDLSGGETQRVVIARALAQEPAILLMDEPTLHLDMGCQLEILDLVKRLCRENGMSVVSVYHDLNLASRYSDRLVLLKGGRILAAGEPGDVLAPGNIRDAYGVEVLVERHPVTGSLHVVPVGRVVHWAHAPLPRGEGVEGRKTSRTDII